MTTSEPAAPRPGLSPSRTNDYLQCPLLFRLRTVDRLPEAPSAAASRGTLVHAVLERVFDEPAGQRTPGLAHELLGPAWDAMVERDPALTDLLATEGGLDGWFERATALIDTWFTLEDPNRLEPAEREMWVRTELDVDGTVLELRGVIDRLDVAPDGALRVVDYKSGRSPRPGYESSALFQMRFYALALERVRGRLPAMLQLVYLGDGQILRRSPSATEVASTENRIRSVWSGVRSAASSGTWPTRTSRLCDWCSFRSLCPAFGGTPPEADPDAVERATGVRPLGA